MKRIFDSTAFAALAKKAPKLAIFDVLAAIYAQPYMAVAVDYVPTQEVIAHLAVKGPLLGLN